MAVPVARQHGPGLRAWSRSRTTRSHCWSGTQKSHFVQTASPRMLGVPLGERACDLDERARAPTAATTPTTARRTAAVLAKAVGKPVRAAIHAQPGHRLGPERPGLDPHAPAPRSTPRATSSPTSSSARASRGSTCNTNGSKLLDTLAGQTLGVALKSGDGFGVPAESYEFANKRTSWETIAPLLDRSSPLRTSHLRDPVGPANPFRQRIVHGRGGGGDQPGPGRVPAEAHQGRRATSP